MEVIYRISWFATKKHRISHTDMYYLNEKDTRWAHNSEKGCGKCVLAECDVVRIEVIMVDRNTKRGESRYQSAVNNSESSHSW
jgi:hypothetical protein